MGKFFKIVGTATVLGVLGFAIARLFKAGNTGSKLGITLINMNPPKIKSGALVLSVNAAFDNPTDHTLNLKKPVLTIYFGGSEIANSIPTSEVISIAANGRTTIKDINIQVPFIKLGSLMLTLLIGKMPSMAFDVLIRTEADGIPYTNKQHFEV